MDLSYDNDTSQQNPNVDPLGQQTGGLETEIKAIEKEIQTKEIKVNEWCLFHETRRVMISECENALSGRESGNGFVFGVI